MEKAGYKKTVHFGTDDEGLDRLDFINSQAKELGLIGVKGTPSISGYVVHLVDKERKRLERLAARAARQ